MSNSEMLIPIKVLKNNESAGSIKQQFEEYIDFSGFSEIPTIDSLKELFTKENIQILNEVIRPGKDKKNWRLDLKIENNNKLTIWANSLSNNELECLFIGTENDSVRNKAKLAKIISGYFGCLLYYSMTGEGFVIEPDEELDKIEKKYLTEFKNSRDWKQKLKNN